MLKWCSKLVRFVPIPPDSSTPSLVRSAKVPPVQVVTLAATQSQATVFAKRCMFPLTFMTPL